jgi:hypothetical protein
MEVRDGLKEVAWSRDCGTNLMKEALREFFLAW